MLRQQCVENRFTQFYCGIYNHKVSRSAQYCLQRSQYIDVAIDKNITVTVLQCALNIGVASSSQASSVRTTKGSIRPSQTSDERKRLPQSIYLIVVSRIQRCDEFRYIDIRS
jgi:hypothetical protein